MTDLEKRAANCYNDLSNNLEARIVLRAQVGVISQLRKQLVELEYKYRQAEYNYASAMLTKARKDCDGG